MYKNEHLIAIHNSKIGFEFEFFPNNKDLNILKDLLSQHLNKKIRIEDKAHSDFKPSQNTFKLEPDMSGGSKMVELVTGPLLFNEAKLILAKTFKWIRENGYTDNTCSIHVNLAFDYKKLGNQYNMMNLDIGKFVLSFDEEYIFKLFPNRKNSVYAKSIKFITPLAGSLFNLNNEIDWRNYKFVNNKYYGVNFTKIPKGYLEFRYLGGKDYESKYNFILNITEHFIISLYDCLTNPTYDKSDKKELNKIIKKYKKILNAFRSYKNFKKTYPDINLTIDLNKNENIIELYYPKIRNIISNLITESSLVKGDLNYDSDIGKIQLKNVDLKKCFLIESVDLVDSDINGNINLCDLYNCNIKKSSVDVCNIFGDSEIQNSKIQNSYIGKGVIVEDSYIYGKNSIFNGIMNGGIFRMGKATRSATFNDTEIVEIEKIN